MSLAKLHPRLKSYVIEKGWGSLTPIQTAAFDPIFEGKSCTIEAPTSGGKTEAVLFPLLTRIAPNKTGGFKVLYVAPLKALLNDLALRVVPYAKMCYLEAFKWHGDVNQSEKINQMTFPSDILLTTPESLEAILLRKSNWHELFGALETVVIDEAHYFALTERGSHLVSILERIERGIKKNPQRIAVTATIGNPVDLLRWITGKEEGIPIKTKSSQEKERDFLIRFFDEDKESLHLHLYNLLLKKKSIVFEGSRTNTEDTASRLHAFNNQIDSRFELKVRTHHSSVGKRMREDAERGIKSASESSLDAIISTSTLELGIDIGDLDQVVQIGGLTSPGSFLQRVGRTGRRVGRKQVFRGLCSDRNEFILLVGCVNLGLHQEPEAIIFPKKAYHILAHQVICLCLQRAGITLSQVWEIISEAPCFRGVTKDDLKILVDHMVQEKWLRQIEGGILLTDEKTENNFLRSNWRRLFAIFDTGPMYDVMDGKKQVGTLDSGFVRSLGDPPFVFVLGGIEWYAEKIDHERQVIKVKKNTSGVPPKWNVRANFDIPFELAQEVGEILMTNSKFNFLDPNAQEELNRSRMEFGGLNWRRNELIFDISNAGNGVIVWTFAGDKVNRALARLLCEKTGTDFKYNYQNVETTSTKQVSVSDIENALQWILSQPVEHLEETLERLTKAVWFSKFSECLPSSLAQKALSEKMFDINNLKKLKIPNS